MVLTSGRAMMSYGSGEVGVREKGREKGRERGVRSNK